ncbi:Uncharacterised protein [Chryseobacterium nakagawai]|uniref:Bacteriocin n=1 Tax=Chryseobacterium nakagawai TaxID=1241982 RepID=A0AAD1DQN1_CHRNA|nr:bacteriocin [Chryseobacterium nakagawai]AZA90906.1 bacteriocin [Chryseobacterium nakagawai]VEH22444.1 Uncharacterised protein [Chryseobacterium nakagawai]
MKKLKKLSKKDLKTIKGGGDFCKPGAGDICGQYGLECGMWFSYTGGQYIESHMACM